MTAMRVRFCVAHVLRIPGHAGQAKYPAGVVALARDDLGAALVVAGIAELAPPDGPPDAKRPSERPSIAPPRQRIQRPRARVWRDSR